MPGDNTSFINGIGLGFTLLMCALMLVLPRRYALVPVIVLVCFMTLGQRIVILGLNFTMIRILALFGWARLLLRGEVRPIKLNAIDKMLLWWTLSSVITYTLLWQNYEALKYKLGGAYDAIGLYFLFRYLVLNRDDVYRVFKIVAFFIPLLATAMVLERTTGRNAFAIFGGVNPTTIVRNGTMRSQGPFAHSILAGTFGATQLPLFVALWWREGRNKVWALIGIISSTIIIVTAGSSGPVMAYLAGVLGLCMWYWRKQMRTVRWGIVLTLIALHMVMKAPVWFIMDRVSVFSGSDGWHRAYLIDRAVANFSDWWLVGTESTEKWGYSLWDITNQYISEGANGGLLTMALFITIIVRCFRAVGQSIRAAEGKEPRQWQLGLWAMGAALFGHVMSFLTVSYFDQNVVNWYLLLAMISTASGLVLNPSPRILAAAEAQGWTR